MRSFFALLLTAAVVTCSSASAATLTAKQTGNAWALYLSGGADNGNFDSVQLSVVPDGSTTFGNNTGGLVSGAPRPAGQEFTYPNRALNSDPLDDPSFKGWSLLDVINTPTAFSFGGGPLGAKISTAADPNGELFLANIFLPTAGARANVSLQLVNAGVNLPTLNTVIGVPEPATLAMAGLETNI